MAAAMISDRGLRRKLTQELAIPDKQPRKAPKRKPTPSSSKDKKSEQNNNQSKKPKVSTGDPKLDLFNTYQPWVVQTYGDLAKTKTITLKKYARIVKVLKGEECHTSDSSKFRFWVKAKGFHLGKPLDYEAKPADAIVCRYSVRDVEGCAINPDGTEIYTGSRNDPALYVPTPPLKVENTLLDMDEDNILDFSEKKQSKKRRNSARRTSSSSSAPFVLNTPSPRPSTPFGLQTNGAQFLNVSPPAPFLTPPIGVATPLTPLASIYTPKKKKIDDQSIFSRTESLDLPQFDGAEDEFEMFAKLIANQLRKLPLSLALDTQLKIQTLVNAARIQAVYQQYSYAGPSREAASVTALSNNILSNIISHNSKGSLDLRQGIHIKPELIDSEIDE